MEVLKLSHPSKKIIGKIQVPGSKSESNRLLILKYLYFPGLEIGRLSDSRDSRFMEQALKSTSSSIDVGDAGTAMRFLTAYYSINTGKSVRLAGTDRMHERPIGILAEALKTLGAEILYEKQEGYPPLLITGKKLKGGILEIDGSVSSQFISALMMIGPSMEQGLSILVKGFSVSTPYIYLTANLMRRLGFEISIRGEEIIIKPRIPKSPATFAVEPDWSAASYWFLMSLLAEKAEIYLPGFRQYSLQGDAFVSGLFEPLGVESHFIGSGFRLKKSVQQQERFSINLIHNPDLAPTMAVAFAAKNIPARISGLQTLKIKETDRLEALKVELEKTGAQVKVGEDFLEIVRGIQHLEGLTFSTYKDHRMAMAFAPLALLAPIFIKEPDVVVKSYQNFWSDLQTVGFELQ